MSSDLENLIRTALDASVEETFSTMFSLNPEVSMNTPEEDTSNGVLCYIAIAGDIEGACTICLPKEGAYKITSLMLGKEITEFCSDVIDGTGEILNIILGGVKTRLVDKECSFEMSVPTYIKSYNISRDEKDHTHIINRFYELRDFYFAIDLGFKQND